MADKEIKYHVYSDNVFDEKGSKFLSLRQVAWGVGQDEEPEDKKKIKYELRRWRNFDGKERADKGFAFLTEDGPHECVNALLEEGFGHTDEVLDIIRRRDDFESSVRHLYDDKAPDGEEYFDPRDILFGGGE